MDSSAKRLLVSEMKLLRSVKGCCLRRQLRNEDIRKVLKVSLVIDRTKEYTQDLKSHMKSIVDTRITKQAMKYRLARRKIAEDLGPVVSQSLKSEQAIAQSVE